jgi:Protein of unknown function (DUF2891)
MQRAVTLFEGIWFFAVVSPDPSDPKLAHLGGLNLSRAWMLEGIAAALPKGDKRLPMIMVADGKALRRRALVGELCTLSSHTARHSPKVRPVRASESPGP